MLGYFKWCLLLDINSETLKSSKSLKRLGMMSQVFIWHSGLAQLVYSTVMWLKMRSVDLQNELTG